MDAQTAVPNQRSKVEFVVKLQWAELQPADCYCRSPDVFTLTPTCSSQVLSPSSVRRVVWRHFVCFLYASVFCPSVDFYLVYISNTQQQRLSVFGGERWADGQNNRTETAAFRGRGTWGRSRWNTKRILLSGRCVPVSPECSIAQNPEFRLPGWANTSQVEHLTCFRSSLSSVWSGSWASCEASRCGGDWQVCCPIRCLRSVNLHLQRSETMVSRLYKCFIFFLLVCFSGDGDGQVAAVTGHVTGVTWAGHVVLKDIPPLIHGGQTDSQFLSFMFFHFV